MKLLAHNLNPLQAVHTVVIDTYKREDFDFFTFRSLIQDRYSSIKKITLLDISSTPFDGLRVDFVANWEV